MSIKIYGKKVEDVRELQQRQMQYIQGNNNDIVNVQESTELGETLKQLNDDTRDPATKMSGIDMRTRLHFSEISSIIAIDTLVSFNFIPDRCLAITLQKKRLNISEGGKGRDDIVNIAGGKRENDIKKGLSFGERIFGQKKETP
jgi:hypothetical protein